ncbi:MAG: YMGG-like glycine zipper-containing protein [Thermodesulfobacteriota bacterium]
MATKCISAAILVVFCASFAGCATMREHKGAATGAGVGAAAGAVTGALIGDTRGAIIGGLAGALLGGAVGHYGYDQKKNRLQTARAYDYQPSQGPILAIEEVAAEPASAHPGETVNLRMTYAVLNPAYGTETPVTEIREIDRDGEQVGRPTVTVDRGDGTYTSTVPVHLPKKTPQGTYRVKMLVQAGDRQDSREVQFRVR